MKSIIKATELKQCVLAMMRGDGFTDVNYNSGKARLDIYHCKEQLKLLQWKASVLEQITGITCKITKKTDNRVLKSGKSREGFRLQTNFSRYLFNLHQTPNKFKMKQLVKPLALAVLWQDDGTLVIRKPCGSYSTATLCSDAWSKEEIQMFQKYFNTSYGWCMETLDYKCRGKTSIRLRMKKNQMQKFTEIVKSYTQPCMMYKLL